MSHGCREGSPQLFGWRCVCVFHELYKGPTTLGISMVDLGRASLVA